MKLFSKEPTIWARHRIVVSPSVFRESYVFGYTRWFLVAWFIGQWITFQNDYAEVSIQCRVRRNP